MAPRVLLIGGASHCGKSTLAARLASRPGWTAASTDRLARHPGRPWVPKPYEVPPHVRAHYRDLSPEALLASVLEHYERVWPLAEALIRAHAEDPAAERLVLEGSALWPPLVANLKLPQVSAIWLTAEPTLSEDRIRRESGCETASAEDRLLVEKFLERTCRFDRAMMAEVARLGLPSLAVQESPDIDHLAARALDMARPLA